MKLLVLGFDCLSSDQFNRKIMPRLKARLDGTNNHHSATARIWSRGWADMMCGCDANTHGGYYDFPLQNGTPDWSKSVNLELIGRHTTPFWERPEINKRIGVVLNIPTTFPAPSINGVFVSGAGGGSPVRATLAPDCVQPADVLPLFDQDYVQDLRLHKLRTQGMPSPEEIDKLLEMEVLRLNKLEQLVTRVRSDYAVVVNRATAVMNYAFGGLYQHPDQNPTAARYMECFYQGMDKALESFLDRLNPQHTVIISDHGFATKSKVFNLNVWLKQNGFLKQPPLSKKQLLVAVKDLIPYGIRQKLKKSKSVGQLYSEASYFNREQTQAFCISPLGTNFGIYINTQDRFGGPVETAQRDQVCEQLMASLTADQELAQLGFQFSLDGDGSQLADIQVNAPEGFYQNDNQRRLITEIAMNEQQLFIKIPDENVSAIKSTDAIFSAPQGLLEHGSADLCQLPRVMGELLK